MLRKFKKLPVLRYLDFCNVLYIWSIRAIPTYRVGTKHEKNIISTLKNACFSANDRQLLHI